MSLLIDNWQNIIEIDEEVKNLFEGVLSSAIDILKIKIPLEVSLLLTDNNDIRGINNDFRSIDKPTDVLSFPMFDLPTGDLDALNEELSQNLFSPDEEIVLGDIVISVERAIEQADEYGHSLYRELGFLMAHGMLHLLGYDHEADDEISIEMRRLEEEILGAVGLTRDI